MSSEGSPVSPDIRSELLSALVGQDIARANRHLADYPGLGGRLTVERTDHPRPVAAAPIWRIEPDGTSRFRFHVTSWQTAPGQIFTRWIAMLPLIAAVLAVGRPGRCWLNLGDEAHRPGLTFCGNLPEHVPIPDHYFMDTHGYRELRDLVASRDIAWRDRAAVAFWRGTTTGPYGLPLAELPRVRLSRLARSMGAHADIGLSDATDAHRDQIGWLQAEGLWKDYVPIRTVNRYQVHVDIDGHSNSWPGLISKLHSGGAILKVDSQFGFRQWYYDRLRPWEHYVPVKSDLSDFVETAEFLLRTPGRAEEIGRAGQAVAREMTFEAEMARIVPIILAAFEPL